MTFRKVVAALNGTESDHAALAAAAGAAAPFNGHVEGIFVRLDPRDTVVALGEGISGPMVEQIIAAAEQEAAERLSRARAAVERMAAARGAPLIEGVAAKGSGLSVGWSERNGPPEEIIVDEARLSDLLVLARAAVETDTNAEVSFETALLQSGRPLLLAPPTVPERLTGTILVAWNGSVEGTRAVAAALTLIAKAERVVVATVETAKTTGQSAEDLAGYLAWHGVRAQVRQFSAGAEPVGATLLRAAAEVSADLLVTGGYGHSRWRELILGGVTRHLLSHTSVPVLMTH